MRLQPNIAFRTAPRHSPLRSDESPKRLRKTLPGFVKLGTLAVDDLSNNTMAYRAEVDKKLCTSVASCVAIAANTFELDENSLAQVKKQNGDPDALILQAAQSCPVNAITVFDDKGAKLWPKV